VAAGQLTRLLMKPAQLLAETAVQLTLDQAPGVSTVVALAV